MKINISAGRFGIFLLVISAVLGASLMTSCVGYRLGSSLPTSIKTVYIPAFINNTGEPMVETEATKATIQEVQKDGSLEVASQEYADSILTVTLTKVKFEPLSFQQNSRKTANEYRLYIYADVMFTRAKTNQILCKRQVYGEATFFPAGDIASAKRLALPNVAKDLAHRIVEAVVEYW